MRRKAVFEREYQFAVVSGLVGEPEKYKVRLCIPCLIEFARTQIMELNVNQVRLLAGKGRTINRV